jgi:hypothetical protein
MVSTTAWSPGECKRRFNKRSSKWANLDFEALEDVNMRSDETLEGILDVENIPKISLQGGNVWAKAFSGEWLKDGTYHLPAEVSRGDFLHPVG